MTEETTGLPRERVMIIDDDEITAALLGISLQDDFEILAVVSGEDGLGRIGAFRPEVVLLDIVMEGIDGYETCRRLRELECWGTTAEQPAVVFVSSHDTLEERLLAYESGGDDFIVKPPAPAEVQRKVRAMVKLVAERKRLAAEKDSVQQMAMGFLTNLGENGTALQYLRGGFACADVSELARLTIAALDEYGLRAHVQMRPPGSCMTFSPSGTASPLEESVFAQVRGLDRIFQFHRRLIVNYPHVSVLVDNLPVEDEDRCGRLRDHLAIIAEGCESSLVALIHLAEIEDRTRRLKGAAESVRIAIETLRGQYRRQQAETRIILHKLSEQFGNDLIFMGLTEKQEDQLQALLSRAVEEALQLFQRGLDFDEQLGGLLDGIRDDAEFSGQEGAVAESVPFHPRGLGALLPQKGVEFFERR